VQSLSTVKKPKTAGFLLPLLHFLFICARKISIFCLMIDYTASAGDSMLVQGAKPVSHKSGESMMQSGVGRGSFDRQESPGVVGFEM
jgi:hypothetical protein